jgi:hypothetical protein
VSTLAFQKAAIGGDPEFFLVKDGQVIGSEKVIPEKGATLGPTYPKFIRDGVQVELNYKPASCMGAVTNHIGILFELLQDHLTIHHPGVSIALTPSVWTVTQEELDTLSPKSKVLGCMPSENLYDPGRGINVQSDYPVRSAGGHIHLPCDNWGRKHAEDLVSMMDVLVGNTCVLLDRDPRAAERREVYGRAGEFRRPPHGVEYRALSNFWLRSPALFSFIQGMSRLALQLTWERSYDYDKGHTMKKNPLRMELLNGVSASLVKEAINENDPEKARVTWEVVKGFLSRMLPEDQLSMYAQFPFTPSLFADFEFLVGKGIDHFFPTDASDWAKMNDMHYAGWRAFLCGPVREARGETPINCVGIPYQGGISNKYDLEAFRKKGSRF